MKAGTLDSMEGLQPKTEIYIDHAVKWLAPVVGVANFAQNLWPLRTGGERRSSGIIPRPSGHHAYFALCIRIVQLVARAAQLERTRRLNMLSLRNRSHYTAIGGHSV